MKLHAFATVLLLAGTLLPARAAELAPRVVEALERGTERLEGGEFVSAISDFKRAAKLAGGPCGPCLLGLARAYNATGDREKAAEAARSAIPLLDRQADLAQASNELGVTLAGAEAEKAFRKALELGPPSPGLVRANLAELLLRSGRHAEALDLAREAVKTGAPGTRARVFLCEAKRVLGTPFTPPGPGGSLCSRPEDLPASGASDGAPVQPPRKIFGSVPTVPGKSLRSAKGGESVGAIIDEEGCVHEVQVCEGGDEGFNQAVREAVRQWVFEPAKQNGKPVSVYYTLMLRKP